MTGLVQKDGVVRGLRYRVKGAEVERVSYCHNIHQLI